VHDFSFAESSDIKLYVMDCGRIDVSDMAELSENGEYQGQQISLVNPCFLIRHPKGDLLWDTGHEESLVDTPDKETEGVWRSSLKTKSSTQLQSLGLVANDIEYLSLSHVHPDHSGNANQFSDATFIVNMLEHQYMFRNDILAMFGRGYSALVKSQTVFFTEEYDVFKDGKVVIKSMPGHTPGSSVLFVRLNKSGNLLLTGDLYIHARGRQLNTMLIYNTDKKVTLRSRKNFEAFAKAENARVIIQHEKQAFDSLPQFPLYLN
jgi:glyoxylase-like metal-dependent hydrolase (beta-lactamase superfamily II)